MSGVSGSNLQRRIENIMDRKNNDKLRGWHRTVVITTVVTVAIATLAFGLTGAGGQTPSRGGASQSVTNELTFDAQTEAAIKEIEQSQDVAIHVENSPDGPVVITEATMKEVTRLVIERLEGQSVSGNLTFGLLPTIKLRNDGGSPVSRLVVAFYRDGREIASHHFIANMQPGASHTHKGEMRQRLALRSQLAGMFPGGTGGLTVRVRGGNFADGTSWGEPTPSAPAATTARGGRSVNVRAGVLNGKAVSKPAPDYPAEARAQGISGMVTVAITVDEEGKVITAEAESGPELLREPSVRAAYQAKFSPTLLSGTPVKVSGVVTYNFVIRQ